MHLARTFGPSVLNDSSSSGQRARRFLASPAKHSMYCASSESSTSSSTYKSRFTVIAPTSPESDAPWSYSSMTITPPPQLAILSGHAKTTQMMIHQEHHSMDDTLGIQSHLRLEPPYHLFTWLRRTTQSGQSFFEFANLRSDLIRFSWLLSKVVTRFYKVFIDSYLGLCMCRGRFLELLLLCSVLRLYVANLAYTISS